MLLNDVISNRNCVSNCVSRTATDVANDKLL